MHRYPPTNILTALKTSGICRFYERGASLPNVGVMLVDDEVLNVELLKKRRLIIIK